MLTSSSVARSVARSPVADRSVLITGGTGAFGRAFAERCLADGARRVAILSRGEAKQADMRAAIDDPRLACMIGDVRDPARLRNAFRGVELVIHAAALKRVETCEADPDEADATNIQGTKHVRQACIDMGVSRAVFLSTDKAAHPNTLYGMTKAVAERAWLDGNAYSAGTQTRFSATRYGNVIGSTGSVVPLWRQQAQSGVIAVTDPRMTRFWMTMAEAVDLVLLALREMRGGEVFVPKIGAASILELAEVVAPLATYRVVGLRPGEKLHETLITTDEARSTYDCGTHYVIEPEARSWGHLVPLAAPLVAPDFAYRSDGIPSLSRDALADMVAA